MFILRESASLAEVANALGAVVGSIRQEQILIIAPAGGKCVKVLYPDGPELYAELQEAVIAAMKTCEELVRVKSQNAGAGAVTVTSSRHYTVVKEGGHSVFFACCITCLAVGRPATGD